MIERASRILEMMARSPKTPDRYPGSIYDVLRVVDADVSRNTVVLKSKVLPEHTNNIDVMDGGAITTLLDVVTTISIYSY